MRDGKKRRATEHEEIYYKKNEKETRMIVYSFIRDSLSISLLIGLTRFHFFCLNASDFTTDGFFLTVCFRIVFIENVEIRIYCTNSHITSFIIFEQLPEFIPQDGCVKSFV